MIQSPKAYKSLNLGETISSRIMIAPFNGNTAVIIISCYSPTNVSDEKDKGQFYLDLTTALNTRYWKCKGKLWTHTLPCGKKSHIDYILINAKWKNSALNCEAYNTFTTVGSDHRIVMAKLRLSLGQSKSPTNQKLRYDWSKLLTDNNTKERYTRGVKQEIPSSAGSRRECEEFKCIYTNIISAYEDVARKYIPAKNKVNQHVPWLNDDIIEKREPMLEALDYSNRVKTRISVKKLDDAKKTTRRSFF